MKARTGRAALIVSAFASAILLGVLPDAASALTPNPKATAIATLIAGEPVTAVCGDTEAEWDALPDVAYWEDPAHGAFAPVGLAYIPQKTIYLAPSVCSDLDARNKLAGGGALVVTHEALHVALVSWDEALVECVAGKSVWTAVHALRLPHKIEAAAYREAMREHEQLANDPSGTYAWKGHC